MPLYAVYPLRSPGNHRRISITATIRHLGFCFRLAMSSPPTGALSRVICVFALVTRASLYRCILEDVNGDIVWHARAFSMGYNPTGAH